MIQNQQPAIAVPNSFRAFTLIEMLVVLALVILLLSLIIPAAGRITYGSRKTNCTSQYHQIGIVIGGYAADNMGFMPRQDVPVLVGHNTWDVSNAMVPALIEHGMFYRLLYCPVIFANIPDGQTAALQMMLDSSGNFSILPTMWWVPRRDTITFYITDPNDPNDFPTSVRCPSISKKPVMSDKICSPTIGIMDPTLAQGGHVFNGQLESNSLLFGDGHTESPSLSKIAWRYSGNWGNFY